jgi:plasmid stabilization system protein ParE
MTYSLHPGAERDLADALSYYRHQTSRVVAIRFLDEFERVAKLLAEFPELGSLGAKGKRTFSLRVFPYSVVYRPASVGVKILILRHQHRRPGYGSRRN